ncbi:hypothetical protein [Aeoliella sp. SH292]|uniref:hypothetical protein n=1 Tax=Aeoliella sp. SH292 TaxID=3454464 RepID=UPI003F976C40
MPTSGLVVTAERPEALRLILEMLANEPAVEAAQPIGVRVPLVVETPDKATDKQVWEWLHQLPGVTAVDVAFIYLGESIPPVSQPLEAFS